VIGSGKTNSNRRKRTTIAGSITETTSTEMRFLTNRLIYSTSQALPLA